MSKHLPWGAEIFRSLLWRVFNKNFRIVLAFFFLSSPMVSSAADLSPTYSESVPMAYDHAASPTGWQPSSLFVLGAGAPASQGLTYDSSGNLIVRQAAGSYNFRNNYVGQTGYKIYNSSDPTHTATWVTTGNDATKFLIANGASGSTVTKLIERGLGMDTAGTHHAIIEFTVTANNTNLMRPTRNPDITQYLPAQYGTSASFVQPAGMSDTAYANFKSYYDYWKSTVYTTDPSKMFPWTQLGYTFFWGNGSSLANITGMSEFIMLGGTSVGIYGIYATQSYLYTRNDGSAFSTAESAQYGNGFASFKIDGTCDTVWAGHRFQAKVSSDTTDGNRNQIKIESNGSVSGGQGLLVWSLNYDVINNGTISGATTDKFNISGTSNVALLFKGDTSTTYGTPVATGVNRVTNAGTIESPGTAVKAEAGSTLIINNAGGVISGGSYAIQTGAADDAVTVNGGRISGDIDLGAGTDSLDVTAGSNATLGVTLNRDTASSARIANTETVKIADNTTIAVTVAGANVRNNDRFLIVDATSLTATPANITVQNNSYPMLTFSLEKSGNQLSLLAARNASYYTQNSGNVSLGAVLDSLSATATGDMATVLGSLDGSGSGSTRQLEPSVEGGIIQAGYGTIGQFNNTVTSRIDQVLAARAGRTGISTGDEAAKEDVWAKGFAARLDQRARGTSNGYDAQVRGLSIGYDRFVFPHLVAGFSGGYARTTIGTSDVNTRTDADSYQGSVYGSLARDAYYIDGILSFAYNDYAASRHIAFGTIDRIAKSNYGGRQYSAYVEGGNTFTKGGLSLTPLASLQYMRLHLNDYTESGADSLNLSVESQDYDLFQTGLGAKLAYPIVHAKGRVIPELHAKWLYDFIGKHQQATSQFTGGGASFTTNGFDPPQSSFNVGAKLALVTKSNATVSLSYDFEQKADFSSHSGSLELRYAF